MRSTVTRLPVRTVYHAAAGTTQVLKVPYRKGNDTMRANAPILAVVFAGLLATGCGGGSQATEVQKTSVHPPMHATDVVDAFTAAGLEADDPQPMGHDDFGLGPYATKGAQMFRLTSLGNNTLGDAHYGRVLVYKDATDLREMREYYDSLGRETAAFFSWTYANEDRLVLVQLSGELDETRAAQYGRVVADL